VTNEQRQNVMSQRVMAACFVLLLLAGCGSGVGQAQPSNTISLDLVRSQKFITQSIRSGSDEAAARRAMPSQIIEYAAPDSLRIRIAVGTQLVTTDVIFGGQHYSFTPPDYSTYSLIPSTSFDAQYVALEPVAQAVDASVRKQYEQQGVYVERSVGESGLAKEVVLRRVEGGTTRIDVISFTYDSLVVDRPVGTAPTTTLESCDAALAAGKPACLQGIYPR
jgi:hypothetical protein